MKKFNLFKEIIIVEKPTLLQAINSSRVFGINIKGGIQHEPFDNSEILIFKGSHKPQPTSALMPTAKLSLQDIFGKNYQIVEDDDRVLIKAFSNWQELIGLNMPRASYDDTTGDGVAEFSNKDLETIGWHATEFEIKYRTLVEHLEDNCDGTLLCIEQEEPYQFSGLGYLSDNEHAKEIMFEFCKNIIKDKIENDKHFAIDTLTDDEEEAAKFFGVI